jgi:NNP family nitrate/nitrite transporter-like MFS transporter
MFLYGVVWVSLILNYTTEVRRLPVMGARFPADHTKTGVA